MFLLAAFSVSCFAADRYMDRMFDVSVEKDVVYAENVPVPTSLNMFTKLLSGIMDSPTNLLVLFDNDSEQEKQNMLMNLYTPKGDSETKRPVVIVAHGGAFVAGARDDEDQQTIQFCDSLAARGYVTAALGYRLGVVMQTEGSNLTVDSADFARTVYRSVQDIRAAIRYFRANAVKLGVDPQKIFVMGNSAGGDNRSCKRVGFKVFAVKNLHRGQRTRQRSLKYGAQASCSSRQGKLSTQRLRHLKTMTNRGGHPRTNLGNGSFVAGATASGQGNNAGNKLDGSHTLTDLAALVMERLDHVVGTLPRRFGSLGQHIDDDAHNQPANSRHYGKSPPG